jgi:MOSC domain-containing protein YiiM
MSDARLLSVHVGAPREITDGASPVWRSAYRKVLVTGPIWLGRAGLAGDGQGDLDHHGGPDQAVLAYAAAHYPLWRAELGRPNFPYGAFAENLVMFGMDEATVCVGDVYAIGAARLQVTQPRGPCGKIARFWQIDDLTARVQENGRTGWYLRVLAEGNVEAGLPVLLRERPFAQWTIARAADVLRRCQDEPEAAADLATCPALGARWAQALRG